MSMPALLSRFAENLFWMARYMERADNLARLLEVNGVFARDLRGTHNWAAFVELNSDRDRFKEIHGDPTPGKVAYFYMLDRENPSSILYSIRAARENARTLRPLISTEMWTHLNVVYNGLLAISASPENLPNIARFCDQVKTACQAHAGITEGTFFRDQGWYFYQLGKHIERADQTTRLVDVKYHTLLPSVQDIGSSLDLSQWNAVLRSAAGYHAYRRVHPRGIDPKLIAEFLVLNNRFPRSVRYCVTQVSRLLSQLIYTFQLTHGDIVANAVETMHRRLEETDIDEIVRIGTHEFLDQTQIDLIEIANAMGKAYFGYGDEECDAA